MLNFLVDICSKMMKNRHLGQNLDANVLHAMRMFGKNLRKHLELSATHQDIFFNPNNKLYILVAQRNSKIKRATRVAAIP